MNPKIETLNELIARNKFSYDGACLFTLDYEVYEHVLYNYPLEIQGEQIEGYYYGSQPIYQFHKLDLKSLRKLMQGVQRSYEIWDRKGNRFYLVFSRKGDEFSLVE